MSGKLLLNTRGGTVHQAGRVAYQEDVSRLLSDGGVDLVIEYGFVYARARCRWGHKTETTRRYNKSRKGSEHKEWSSKELPNVPAVKLVNVAFHTALKTESR